ncbi:hypothetical protein STEG23_007965, partial [Scotinomys teguina]
SLEDKFIVEVGKNAHLPCSYTLPTPGTPVPMCWGKGSCPFSKCSNWILSTDERNLTHQKSRRYQLKGKFLKGDVSLTIENVTLDDSGTYCCRVEFPGLGNDQKLDLELVITSAKLTPPATAHEDTAATSPRTLTTEGDGSRWRHKHRETQTLGTFHDQNQTQISTWSDEMRDSGETIRTTIYIGVGVSAGLALALIFGVLILKWYSYKKKKLQTSSCDTAKYLHSSASVKFSAVVTVPSNNDIYHPPQAESSRYMCSSLTILEVQDSMMYPPVLISGLVLLPAAVDSFPEVHGAVGHRVTLPCTYPVSNGLSSMCWGRGACASDTCGQTLLWTDGHRIYYRTNSRYQLKGQLLQGDVSLTIENVTESDSGLYCCRVEMKGWNGVQRLTTSLQVQPGVLTRTTPKKQKTPANPSYPIKTHSYFKKTINYHKMYNYSKETLNSHKIHDNFKETNNYDETCNYFKKTLCNLKIHSSSEETLNSHKTNSHKTHNYSKNGLNNHKIHIYYKEAQNDYKVHNHFNETHNYHKIHNYFNKTHKRSNIHETLCLYPSNTGAHTDSQTRQNPCVSGL